MSQFSNDLANGTLCRQISIILVKVDVTNRVQLQVKVLGNSRDREKVKNMSPGDSSLRTGSIWLAFVTGENALDSQNWLISSRIAGWAIYRYFMLSCVIVKTTARGAVDSTFDYFTKTAMK